MLKKKHILQNFTQLSSLLDPKGLNFSCCKNAEKELKNIFINIANGKSLK